MRFPDDVSVISFDSPWWMDHVMSPALTYVGQEPYEIGRQAMCRLARMIDAAEQEPAEEIIRIPTRLEVRQSVSPPAGRDRRSAPPHVAGRNRANTSEETTP